MFRQLDRLGLKMIEQPLAYDDLVDHAALQKELQTPGSALTKASPSVRRAAKAIKSEPASDQHQNKPWVGGLTNALAIHDLCRDQGVPVWVGGMLESAVGQGPSMALATMDNIGYPCDIFPSSRFFAADFFRPRDHPFSKGQDHGTIKAARASRQKWTFCKNTALRRPASPQRGE